MQDYTWQRSSVQETVSAVSDAVGSAAPLASASSNKFNKMPRSGPASSTQCFEAAPASSTPDHEAAPASSHHPRGIHEAAPDWGSGGTGSEVDSAESDIRVVLVSGSGEHPWDTESDIRAPSTSSDRSYGIPSTPTYEAAPGASPTYEAAPAASSSSTTDPPVPAPRLTNKQRRLASYRVRPQHLVDPEMALQAYEAGARAVRGIRNWR